MALEKCKQFNMTLPHLESAKSTREFVAYIMDQYTLPMYAIFVGLVKKVKIISVRN